METIRMADIISFLPVPAPPPGRRDYNVHCPQCDDPGKRNAKHLNINFTKNVFRCARCGWNGGIFDLYSFYSGTPRTEVKDELYQRLRLGDSGSFKKTPVRSKAPDPPVIVDSPMAAIEIRHATYSALLSLLALAPDHCANLTGRGLSMQAVAGNGYRTTPMVGGPAIAKRLLEGGHQLDGVPGFYKDKSGVWTFVKQWRGILIPVRDTFGRIQGLQVRRDDSSKGKFRWTASAGIKDSTCGCGAETWVHMAGPVRERILLIEGPMKADIVHDLTGQTVLAVPGVNALTHLERSLKELHDMGVTNIMTAFDMDYLKNPHVQNGYAGLVALLGRIGFRYGTYLWDPAYNGLDDYVWKYCLNSNHSA